MTALTDNKSGIKKQLIDFCIQKQNVTIEAAREAMIRVQDSANEETAGGEDKFESFREQCQIDRDMYAKKINESMQGLAILKGLTTKLLFEASLGAVIITESQRFFVSIGLGEIVIDGVSYFAISTQSPLYLAMNGKKVGEQYEFRGKRFLIKDVF